MLARLFLILSLLATPLWAVEPDEMLSDPALEARAQALDLELRCVQCQSESIASSNADWSRDARLMVRELISGGATDEEVKTFFVERYGERVLMEPRHDGVNALLWWAGPLMLLAALVVALFYLRGRRRGAGPAPLSAEEEERLKEILGD